ncbi:hypothetical protein HanIR_Chr05g0227711 [Helianthus annuus]|nr:hypothetical protein HanIR_Chr05g0227711 [Helianthus annuus]
MHVIDSCRSEIVKVVVTMKMHREGDDVSGGLGCSDDSRREARVKAVTVACTWTTSTIPSQLY